MRAYTKLTIQVYSKVPVKEDPQKWNVALVTYKHREHLATSGSLGQGGVGLINNFELVAQPGTSM